ncbi:hypothetical protein FJT64_010495 [Amphibalanus amphitrite]|uniref:Uncharacterized protein n=1 Tax=Amphibalanus amphitrite TaxID=1232801 RepID=A0A6A4V574_AMPAM|nr:hypothetical protein FJT64_010495 [Amphibalanus amphitrite]
MKALELKHLRARKERERQKKEQEDMLRKQEDMLKEQEDMLEEKAMEEEVERALVMARLCKAAESDLEWERRHDFDGENVALAPRECEVEEGPAMNAVEGPAAQAINGMLFNGELYQEALKTLQERFGREEDIIQAHLRKVFTCTPPSLMDLPAMEQFYSVVHNTGLLSLLQGGALDYFTSLSEDVQGNLQQTVAALEARFGTAKNAMQAQAELASIRQQPGEATRDFADRVRQASREAYPGAAAGDPSVEATIVSRFVCGLRDEQLRMRVLTKDPASLMEAMDGAGGNELQMLGVVRNLGLEIRDKIVVCPEVEIVGGLLYDMVLGRDFCCREKTVIDDENGVIRLGSLTLPLPYYT